MEFTFVTQCVCVSVRENLICAWFKIVNNGKFIMQAYKMITSTGVLVWNACSMTLLEVSYIEMK